MTDYRAFLRRRALEDMYDRLSPEERRLFVQMTIQDKGHEEIMEALSELRQKADKNHHSFASDFGANIAGNAVWEGLMWLGGRLLRRL